MTKNISTKTTEKLTPVTAKRVASKTLYTQKYEKQMKERVRSFLNHWFSPKRKGVDEDYRRDFAIDLRAIASSLSDADRNVSKWAMNDFVEFWTATGDYSYNTCVVPKAKRSVLRNDVQDLTKDLRKIGALLRRYSK